MPSEDDEDNELVAFSRADASRILEVADSFRIDPKGPFNPGKQLFVAIGKTQSSIAASAADTGSTVQLYKGKVTIHGINASDQRYATASPVYEVDAFNLAPSGAVGSGKLVIIVREMFSNKWFVVWELCT